MEQVFVVKDGEEIIFRGTSKQIKKEFRLKESFHAGFYSRRSVKILSKYTVEPYEEDNHLEWQIVNLRLYGNTVAVGNVEQNVKELKELGFDVVPVGTRYRVKIGKWETSWRLECTKQYKKC